MLILKKKFLDKIIAQARKELPNEACGILAGKDEKVNGERPSAMLGTSPEHIEGRSRTVEKVYEMSNTDASPSTFFMEAKEQLKVMKEIRNSGIQMIGIYHSHVASQAYPSAHDVELAFYPEVSYAIISLQDNKNPVARSFKIQKGKIKEEEVRIE